MKRIASIMIAGTMVLGSVGFASGSMSIPKDVIKTGDFSLFPLKEVAEGYGYKAKYNSSSNSVDILLSDVVKSSISLRTGMVNKGGQTTSGAGDFKNINGKLYVSLSLLNKLLDKTLSVTNSEIVENASTTKVDKYNVSQLTDMALANDKLVMKSGFSLDRATENVDYASVNFFVRVSGTGQTAYDAANASKEISFQASQVQKDLAEKDVVTQKDVVRITVQTLVEKILSTQNALDLSKKSYDVDLQDNINNRVKYQQGLLSEYLMKKDDLELSSLKAKIDAQQKDITISYDKLNKLIGKPAGSVYNLDAKIERTPFTNINLEGEVASRIAESPQLYALKKQAEITKLSIDYYVPNQGDTYQGKLLDYEKSKLDASNAEVSTRKAIVEVYNTILKLQEARKSLELDYVKAKQDLQTVTINYSVGLSTMLDVKKAELAVSDLENQILANTVQHNTLVRTFYKPWITSSDN